MARKAKSKPEEKRTCSFVKEDGTRCGRTFMEKHV
jgi:hypothetical protein